MRSINTRLRGKRTYGLIGYPVAHSLSPAMHNAAFSRLKINAEYRLFALKPPELSGFFSSLPEKNISGLNVTVPYKEKVMPFLDSLSAEASLIGAVNTVRVSGSKLEGFNTDGAGFLRQLKEDLKFNPKNKIIAVIGAGGASRAVSVSLSQAKAKSIVIYDIEENKASTLIKHLKKHFEHTAFRLAGSPEQLDIRQADLLINATPIGMKEKDPCPVEGSFMHSRLLVCDLIYNPAQTKLLKLAKDKGAGTANGLGMLLYQGALSFEYFTGRKAPLGVMRQALKQGVRNL